MPKHTLPSAANVEPGCRQSGSARAVALIARPSGALLGLHIVGVGKLATLQQCAQAAEELYDAWRATSPDHCVDDPDLDIYILRR
jgi:hypothetical protein